MVRKIVTEDRRGYRTEIEEWLNGWGVAWTLHEAINIDNFDIERSLRNQARLGAPVDTEYVERYATAMRDGAEFPGVVAWRDDRNTKLVIIDGNHRMMAAREAEYELPVYVVKDAKVQTITAMTFEANVRHGKSTTEDERIHHALWLIDNGMNVTEAAKRMAVPKSKVNKANSDQAAGRRADSVGITRRDWDGIPQSYRVRLGMIHTDEGFRAAVKLVKDAGLLFPEITEMVSTMNDTRSGQRQEGLVKSLRNNQYAERIQEVKAGGGKAIGKRVRSPKASLSSGLGLLHTIPSDDVIVASLGAAEREDMAAKVDEAVARLTTLRAALVGA